jgi:hypothetical protein
MVLDLFVVISKHMKLVSTVLCFPKGQCTWNTDFIPLSDRWTRKGQFVGPKDRQFGMHSNALKLNRRYLWNVRTFKTAIYMHVVINGVEQI